MLACVCVCLHVRMRVHVCIGTRRNTLTVVSSRWTDIGVFPVLLLGGVGKSCLTGEWSPPIDMGISCSPCRELPVKTSQNHGSRKGCGTDQLPAAQFVHNEWIESYDPTIEDSYQKQLAVDVCA